MRKIKVVHIINSFEFGGAEAMLGNLVLRADRERFDLSVIALIDDLTVADPVRRAGVPLATIGMKPGVLDPRTVARLARQVIRERPDVVQTWMDHSNLIGGLATRLTSRARLVWGLHHSNHVPGLTKQTTLMTVSACARLSRRIPARIVCCSEQTRLHYVRGGFARDKMVVITNGFDTELLRPDPAARLDVRRELGLDPDATLVGLVARYHPLKDHGNFLRAAAILARRLPEVKFLLCGDRVDRTNTALVDHVEALGLSNRCLLLGARRDIPRIQAALDVAASSSVSEAFPLAVGEAMSCGVPCVATDVGDSARIVASAGRIVPARDPQALAENLRDLIVMEPGERRRLGLAARQRIRTYFELATITRRYEELYADLATGFHNPLNERGRPGEPLTVAEPRPMIS